MAEQISFLPNSVKALRTMLTGIIGSYDNAWDLLAELTQNSVDAVRRTTEQGLISVQVDQTTATITVEDTGTGINPNGAAELFSPFGTDKDEDADTIGEKGVGLKYVIFSSRRFHLRSHHKNGSFEVLAEGAAEWVRSRSNELFNARLQSIENPEGKRGTEIVVQLDDAEHPLLGLGFKQLKALLLTRTALGSTKPIWDGGENENFEVELKLKEKGKKAESEVFEARYLLPTDVLKKSISIDEYNEWRRDSDPSDAQKRTKIKNKIIYHEGSYVTGGREVKHWFCIMPSSDQFFLASKRLGIVGQNDADDYSPEQHFYAFHPDITLATKGMPTTVSLDFHPRGDAGYKIQLFGLIEDDKLEFDIGRKGASVGPRTIGMYKQIAQGQFSEMLRFKRFLRGDAGEPVDRFALRDLFNEIDELPDLESEKSAFLKRPNKQEATVAAMFYELMGKGEFDDFKPLISGYRDTYDLTGKVAGNPLVIEFKYELMGLFRDFKSLTKMFDDIDVVALWEVTEADRKHIASANIQISKLEDADRTLFPKSHFLLQTDTNRSIEVVEVKRLIGA